MSDFWYPHTVTVRDRMPAGSRGYAHGDPRNLDAEVLDEQRMVRTDGGQEVLSSTRVTVPIGAAVTVGALVTVWPGESDERESEVLVVQRDVNDLPLPSHLILSLT